MNTLGTQIYKKPLSYDGTQLRPHWIYETFDLLDDAIVAFTGPADVPLDHMVDLEDRKHKDAIYSPNMLHFIGEWFHHYLDIAILHQHLFTQQIYEMLWERGIRELSRKGNDLYFQERKLSVSIATSSSVSVLMHTALNIETQGTPIPTSGLNELDIAPLPFAESVLQRFQEEYHGWEKARRKVIPR